ncbi:hypothetical protein [Pseudobacteroides cellulosolvens]|uniref:Uncharacterized protein n=1 Tax=Pseudobacteroides cellulosolvens ATCC 35603 = DSM 2933 TaxID=398512 RepID=A0A0L6JJ10_9FIRM|nr:hypothetical protein [Pseudobacteroides cellulosolvens]KNY25688.1 hypothetical protein Bccel_0948 [Pseudobacteroides cellulosolvens ATCC 35603 = DSM 2933]
MKRLNKKKLLSVIFTCLAVAMVSIQSFAALDEGTATAMDTDFTAIKSDVLAGLAKVAPYGLAVFGAFLVWKYGKRFFASLAK